MRFHSKSFCNHKRKFRSRIRCQHEHKKEKFNLVKHRKNFFYRCFSTLYKNLQLTNQMRQSLHSHKNSVIQCLNRAYTRERHAGRNCIIIGSLKRDTAINLNCDVDIIYLLPKHFEERLSIWSASEIVDNVAQTICSAGLAQHERIKIDTQAIQIYFQDGLVVEVVPAIRCKDGSYNYPNPRGTEKQWWLPVRPQHDCDVFNKCVRNHGCIVKNTARMLRAWRETKHLPVKGVLIDSLIVDFFSENDKFSHADFENYGDFFNSFFNYWITHQNQKHFIMGSTSYLTLDDDKVNRCVEETRAVIADSFNTNEEKYVNNWKQVFGHFFPAYKKVKTQ